MTFTREPGRKSPILGRALVPFVRKERLPGKPEAGQRVPLDQALMGDWKGATAVNANTREDQSWEGPPPKSRTGEGRIVDTVLP